MISPILLLSSGSARRDCSTLINPIRSTLRSLHIHPPPFFVTTTTFALAFQPIPRTSPSVISCFQKGVVMILRDVWILCAWCVLCVGGIVVGEIGVRE